MCVVFVLRIRRPPRSTRTDTRFPYKTLVRSLGGGYRAEMIEAEIDALGARGFVRTVMNPDFRLGPITTLWALREEIACGEPIVFMDGDVLYDHRVMARLLESRPDNRSEERRVGEGCVKRVELGGGRINNKKKQKKKEPER